MLTLLSRSNMHMKYKLQSPISSQYWMLKTVALFECKLRNCNAHMKAVFSTPPAYFFLYLFMSHVKCMVGFEHVCQVCRQCFLCWGVQQNQSGTELWLYCRHETPVLAKPIKLIHVDEEIVVLDKPCSLPVSILGSSPPIPGFIHVASSLLLTLYIHSKIC